MRLSPLKLRKGDRAILESWTRAGTIEARTAKRARIVLLAADGCTNREIGEIVDLHYNQVGLWRQRYVEFGLAGLDDVERPGRPCVYGHDDVLLLVKLITESPPDNATRWTMEALAGDGRPRRADLGLAVLAHLSGARSETLAGRVLDDEPRPRLLGKGRRRLRAVPEPAAERRRLERDEKTGMQAKSRVNPTRPAVPGIACRREFEYKRNGTAVLFAGLEVHEGTVAGWVTDSTRSENFVEFLGDLVAQTPAGLDLHCIVD